MRVRQLAVDPVGNAAFDAFNLLEAAMARDIGRLRRPRRNRAEARDDQHQRAAGDRRRAARAVSQDALQSLALGFGKRAARHHEMPVLGIEPDAGSESGDVLEELLTPEGGKGAASAQRDELRHELRRLYKGAFYQNSARFPLN
ncbi:hypothetical protein D3C83_06690 [compost metagenome]